MVQTSILPNIGAIDPNLSVFLPCNSWRCFVAKLAFTVGDILCCWETGLATLPSAADAIAAYRSALNQHLFYPGLTQLAHLSSGIRVKGQRSKIKVFSNLDRSPLTT